MQETLVLRILITGNLADTAMAIKNARDMGFTSPIVSDYAIVGPEFIDLGGKYAGGDRHDFPEGACGSGIGRQRSSEKGGPGTL